MTPPSPGQDQVERHILDLLAEQEHCDAGQLRDELTERGPEMPYDSVLLVALIATVERHYAVRLRADLPTARDMRSVRSFAERICEEIEARDETPPESESADTDG